MFAPYKSENDGGLVGSATAVHWRHSQCAVSQSVSVWEVRPQVSFVHGKMYYGFRFCKALHDGLGPSLAS